MQSTRPRINLVDMTCDLANKPMLQLSRQGSGVQGENANPHSNSDGHFRLVKKGEDLETTGAEMFERVVKGLAAATKK